MPLFSAFTPFGMLAFSSKPSHAKSIYRSIVDSKGGPDYNPAGSHQEATCYAQAKSIARCLYTQDRAANQVSPLKATELLPNLEKDYGVRPGALADISSRRSSLSALYKLPAGGSYVNVRAALLALLGSAFIAYRLSPTLAGISYPADPSASGECQFAQAAIPAKLFIATDPVATLGTPVWVRYTSPRGDIARAGDALIVQPDNSLLSEKVVLASAAAGQYQATFTKGHDVGAVSTTGSYPANWSTRRYAMIVVTAAASVDPEQRRAIHELMARVARGVSQWAIVAPASIAGTLVTIANPTLPFPLGTAPFGLNLASTLP